MTVLEAWGMQCPKCGHDDCQDIAVVTNVRLTPAGTDADASDDGAHEWDDQSDCQCTSYGEQGTVLHFKGD